MQQFIASAGDALRTVTSLELTIRKHFDLMHLPWDNIEEDIELLLSPLAGICTGTQQLKVCGEVGAPLLAAFGASCQQLTSLEVTNIGPRTAESLHKLLPNITSTHVSIYDEDSPLEGAEDDIIQCHTLSISSCRTLTELGMTDHSMTEELWRALPPSLQQLHVASFTNPSDPVGLPAGLHLPVLRDVQASGWQESRTLPVC